MGSYIKKNWSSVTILFLFLGLIGVCSYSINAQESDWMVKLRTLKVFESNRADVERIFDSPKIVKELNRAETERDGWGRKVTYNTKSGELVAIYSTGNCLESKNPWGYNVVSDVVVELRFKAKKAVKANRFNFDLKEFYVEYVEDIPDSYLYYNNELGVWLYIFRGKLTGIEYKGSSEDNKRLDCEEVLK
ncbi:MAG TPA: hypothetical protein PKE69_15845 [Pyrinomonadaceae bacterium]|nr:hypothetical protein [Pyrinomonadaceae bacterium]